MPIEPWWSASLFRSSTVVEQRAIVRRPRCTRDALRSARGRVVPVRNLFLQHVLAETRSIGRIGEQCVVLG